MKKTVLVAWMHVAFLSPAFCQGGLEEWSHNHQRASEDLGAWVRKYPASAHELFEWDGRHPERSQELVNWAFAHPRERLEAFVRDHPNWKGMDIFAERHAAAMEEFLFWCRNHAEAAKALMAHSGGLKWAGDHLYRDSMRMEHPNR
jgi:hypothetical protein